MQIVVFGHSHIDCLFFASREPLSVAANPGRGRPFNLFRMPILQPAAVKNQASKWVPNEVVWEEMEKDGLFQADDAAFVSLMGGNEYNVIGLIQHHTEFDFRFGDDEVSPSARILSLDLMRRLLELSLDYWMELLPFIKERVSGPVFHFETPPPIRSEDFIRTHLDPEIVRAHGYEVTISPALLRRKLWMLSTEQVRRRCKAMGIGYLELPQGASDDGFLNREFWGTDATHANPHYGEIALRHIKKAVSA